MARSTGHPEKKCFRHSPYGVYDRLWTVNLNVMTATLRHNESGLERKSSKLLLQPHQGGLPFLEKRSMIRCCDHRERDIREWSAVFDLIVAF